MLRTASSLPLHRAFDAGLQPGPFPDQAASLLPGLLAATRTGLTPAGDNELMSGQVKSNNHLQLPGALWNGRGPSVSPTVARLLLPSENSGAGYLDATPRQTLSGHAARVPG